MVAHGCPNPVLGSSSLSRCPNGLMIILNSLDANLQRLNAHEDRVEMGGEGVQGLYRRNDIFS